MNGALTGRNGNHGNQEMNRDPPLAPAPHAPTGATIRRHSSPTTTITIPVVDKNARPAGQIKQHGQRFLGEKVVHVSERHRAIPQVRLLHGVPVHIRVQRLRARSA